MITAQTRQWTKEKGWSDSSCELPANAQLVFVFGDRELVEQKSLFDQVRQFHPDAYILVGSTSGNILDDTVSDNSVTISALHFEKTKIWYAAAEIPDKLDSQNVGKKLAEFLPTEDLVHSFILSEGLHVNGSDLVRSVNKYLPKKVTVTGGLAGDASNFSKTVVGLNDVPKSNFVALIGFYGKDLKVGYASEGGWNQAGKSYTITKSDGNVLYELNGEPALDVYKELLGPKAEGLPSTALLYPLQLLLPDEGEVVRTVLSVKEEDKSVTFAGDMPEGTTAHLMQTTDDGLIESARKAGEDSIMGLGEAKAQFALMVSCVGRQLVLKDSTSKEVRAAHEAIGSQAVIHGFYSYGELCPGKHTEKNCLLHNQTMTITTFSED